MEKPTPVPIAVVLDFSDSCHELSKQISFLQRLLNSLPGDWPFFLYRLSSPEAIGRPGLRLRDFIESTDLLGELCMDRQVQVLAKTRGSFLRPVAETLANKIEHSADHGSMLAFVMTDGEFTDFGDVPLHPRLEIAALLRRRNANRDAQTATAAWRSLIPTYDIQDKTLDAMIHRHLSPFYGPVALELIAQRDDTDPIDTSRMFRVEDSGRLIPWESLEKHTFNLASRSSYLLVDEPPEVIESLRWKVRSSVSPASAVIEGASRMQSSNRRLDKSIAGNFTASEQKAENEILFQFDATAEAFTTVVGMAETALKLAQDSEPWIDDDGFVRVFRQPPIEGFCDDQGSPACDAVALIRLTSEDTKAPTQIIAISLHSNRDPAFKLASGESLSNITATQSITIRFDPKLYRWFLHIATAPPCELEYYAAEIISCPLQSPASEIEVAFSGSLR